jgi:hypothetical protein
MIVRAGLIWLRKGINGGLFWTWYWTFGFHKMLRNSGVADQQATSQEGLSSMEWIHGEIFKSGVQHKLQKMKRYDNELTIVIFLLFISPSPPKSLYTSLWNSRESYAGSFWPSAAKEWALQNGPWVGISALGERELRRLHKRVASWNTCVYADSLMNWTTDWLWVFAVTLAASPLMSELKSWVGPPSQLDVWPVPVCQIRVVPSLETQSQVLVLGYVPKSQDTRKKRGATGRNW